MCAHSVIACHQSTIAMDSRIKWILRGTNSTLNYPFATGPVELLAISIFGGYILSGFSIKPSWMIVLIIAKEIVHMSVSSIY
jgi:hypothetical protein